MLLDFLELISHPDHYKTTWRDGDLIVEHVPEAPEDSAGKDQQPDTVDFTGLSKVDISLEAAE